MKVLLVEDVAKVGYLGDVVEVKNGYARNYLLPQGIAVIPTEVNLKAIVEEKAKCAAARLSEHKHLEAAAEAVNGAEVVIAAKANVQGHLFGSVAEKDIAANLRAQGFVVTDDVVVLDGHIKEVGTSEVTLKFADGLTAKVTVVVVPEQTEAESPNDEDKNNPAT